MTLIGPPLTPAEHRSSRLAARLLIPLAVLLVAIALVFYVFFRAVRVVGPSMYPTLLSQELVLTTRTASELRRGDVVVATITGQFGQRESVIKRVVALPGDTVRIEADVAIVNGVRETGYDTRVFARNALSAAQSVVPSGTVYLLGDNRGVSFDSRFVGPVPVHDVAARVVAVFSPIHRIRTIPRISRP